MSSSFPSYVNIIFSRDRYNALAAAGFPVIDNLHEDGDLQHHLIERGGGHILEVGQGLNLIATGKVGIRSNVEPVGYTATGLCFSDGSTADPDVVVWCTGFADHDARTTAAEILGGGREQPTTVKEEGSEAHARDGDVPGPQEIAAPPGRDLGA